MRTGQYGIPPGPATHGHGEGLQQWIVTKMVPLSIAEARNLLGSKETVAELITLVESGKIVIYAAADIPQATVLVSEVRAFPSPDIHRVFQALNNIADRVQEIARADVGIALDCQVIAEEVIGIRRDVVELLVAVKAREADAQALAKQGMQIAKIEQRSLHTDARLDLIEGRERPGASGSKTEAT